MKFNSISEQRRRKGIGNQIFGLETNPRDSINKSSIIRNQDIEDIRSNNNTN